MKAKRYIAIAAGEWLGLIAGAVALSVFADPYRLFGTRPVAGWTALKPRIFQEAGMATTYELERVKPRTLLIGNSRVQNGFNPQSAAWPASWQPVFNAGTAGKDLFTSMRLLQEANAAAPVETVIVGVDFTDFLRAPTPPGTYPPLDDDERRLLVGRDGRPNPDRPAQLWRDRYTATLTISALYDDLFTLADQRPQSSVTMTPYGYNPLHEYGFYVRQVGYHGLFAQKTAAYRAKFRTYPHPDFRRPMEIANFRYLVRIIEIAAQRHERLILFVPPYHAEFLDVVRDAGFWGDFEDWKRALVQVVGDENRRFAATDAPVELVDFSGYNAYTEEPVPAKGDLKTPMHWYWEAGHYKATLGDVILKRLITGHGDFGHALSADTVDGVVAESHKPPFEQDARRFGRGARSGSR